MPLSERAQEMLNGLPEYYLESDDVAALLQAVGNETAYVEAAGERMRAQFYPQTADDQLWIWEKLLELPVEDPLLSLEARRALVQRNLARVKRDQAASSFEDRMNEVLGSDWTYYYATAGDRHQIFLERFDDDGLFSNMVYDSGSGLIVTDGTLRVASSGVKLVHWPEPKLDDQAQTIRLHKGLTGTGLQLGLVGRYLDASNFIVARLTDTHVTIALMDGGVLTDKDTDAFTIANDQTVWLRLIADGNDLTAQAFYKDPRLGGAPDAEATYTLVGGEATEFGAITEPVGLRVSLPANDWWLDDWQADGIDPIPDYTVRITMPYPPGHPRLVEARNLARKLIAAHLALDVVSEIGFVLGSSQLGNDPL